MNKLTPINPELPVWLVKAIEEQQSRVWSLRSLLDVLQKAVMDDGSVDDEEAALRAIIDLADQIHLALDTGLLAKRAAKLESETRQEAEREARYVEAENEACRKLRGSEDGEESPEDGPMGTVQ